MALAPSQVHTDRKGGTVHMLWETAIPVTTHASAHPACTATTWKLQKHTWIFGATALSWKLNN